MDIMCVPIITASVYTLVDVIKTAVGENEKFRRFIPLMSCALGVSIALAFYFSGNQMIQASDAITAVIIGGASGASATGVNQMSKFNEKKENKDETD